VANWKNEPPTRAEAKRLFAACSTSDFEQIEVVICPPAVYLSELKTKNSKLKTGSQNCGWDQAVLTGETTPVMLKNLGCQYVILGHSERRAYLGETDALVNCKIKAALAAGLKAIVCVGQPKAELAPTLQGIKRADNLVLVFEPLATISTQGGRALSPELIKERISFIRRELKKIFGRAGEGIPVLYGGNVNEKNASQLLKETSADGFLVGQASLDAQRFKMIIRACIQR
jgi:triosephosphate isomerase